MNNKLLKIFDRHRDFFIFTIDLSIVALSFLITTFGRFDFDIGKLLHYGFQMNYLKAFGVVIMYGFCFYVFKVYKSLWKYMGIQESKNIAYSVLSATFILLAYCFLFNFQAMLINIIIVAGMLIILSMFGIRVIYRMSRYNSFENEQMSKAIIIGAGDAGYMIMKEIEQKESQTVKIIGFVDDKKPGMIVSGKSVLGTIGQLPLITKKNAIDLLYYAIPSATMKQQKRIFSLIESLNIKTKIIKTNESVFQDKNSSEKKYPILDISIEDLLGRGEISLDQHEIKSYIENKTICITGAGGSIGSELSRQIIRFKPRELIMLDINENSLYMLEQEFNRLRANNILNDTTKVISLIASVRDEKAIDEIFSTYNPHAVFHAAAHKHVPLMETRPKEAIKNNIFGTNNVIQCCIKNKVSRFILISTDKAVNPTNVMGATKRMTELLLEANRNNGATKMAAVRFGNVLGSSGSVIPIFKEQIKSGGPVTITDKNIIRYFMTIPEAAQLVLQAGYYANAGDIFVLDMGEPVKILDLAERMIRLAGYRPYEDIDIVEIGLRPGEKMFEELHLKSEQVTKTKNDLIFVNKPLDINLDMINCNIEQLESIIKNGISDSEIKKKLLLMIK